MRDGRWGWPALVCAVTAAYSVLPTLGSPWFYVRGDSASQYLPTWFRLGQMVWEGHWPPTLDPTAWAGGNYAAEALFGIYNPLNVLIWIGVFESPDLRVSALLVKGTVLTLLALGVYVLGRELGAARWAAASVAVAVPYGGYTLYWEGASWVSGLVAFAYTPWVWWAFRRVGRDALAPVWAFGIGALMVTHGNPYGIVAVLVVGVAVMAECWLNGNPWGALRVTAVGICVGAVLPLVFLPLLASSDLARRQSFEPLRNNDFMSPEVGQFLHVSTPTYLPDIETFSDPMRAPVAYLAWFVVVLLPWLRYGAALRRWRSWSSVAVVTGGYLLMALGPSKVWMFRWPLRLVEYVHLGLALALALLLSHGLRTDRWQGRAGASVALVLFVSYLNWADSPLHVARWLSGLVVLGVLTAVLLVVHRTRPGAAGPVAAVLILGTGAVLAVQTQVYPENESTGDWRFPYRVAEIQDRFGDRTGVFVQVAQPLQVSGPAAADGTAGRWRRFLQGSMYAVAGVEAVNRYSGMGHDRFDDVLCLTYNGGARPCAYRRLFADTAEGVPLADLMKVETVLVESGSVPQLRVPEGWMVEGASPDVLLRRGEPLPWPESRLSWVSPDVSVASADSPDLHEERLRVSTEGNGDRTLVFGRVAWPGYRATFDDDQVPVGGNEAGLLTVRLPASAEEGVLEVRYTTPGQRLGVALTGAGVLVTGAWSVLRWRRLRGRDQAAVTPAAGR